VTNVNEAPIQIALSSVTVSENTAVGTVVGDLSTTDEDADNTFTYTLVSGAGDVDNAAFQIVDGQLRTAAAFDFETANTFLIRVLSADQGGLSYEKPFTITVTDVNEAPTGVSLTNATTSIAENTSTAARIKVADIVVTDDGLGAEVITLSGADAASFELDGLAIYLKAGVALDREAKASFAVTVNVDDASLVGSTPVAVGFTLAVSSANEAPTAVALTNKTTSIAENTSTLARIKVADIVVTDDGLGSETITLSGADAASFEVDGLALYLKSGVTLDHETKASYAVMVSVEDISLTGSTPVTATLTLTVTDVNEVPTGVALTNTRTSIAENTSTAARIKVADVMITDDALGSEAITLSGADASSFEVDGPAIYLKAGVTLDYEIKSSYSVTVSVADNSLTGSTSQVAAYTLGISNVNEAPSQIVLSAFTVAENSPIGTVVGVLSTTDVDAGDSFAYTLVSGTGSTGNASFMIDGNSIKTAAVLNFESQSAHSLRVRSTDSGGLFAERAFGITVTDANDAPTGLSLVSVVASLPENAATTRRIKVADLVVADDGLGANTFSLAGVDVASFEIDGSALYLKAGVTLNFETKTSYGVTLAVADTSVAGSPSWAANYTLAITNVVEPRSAPRVVAPAFFELVEDTPTTLLFSTAPFSDTDSPLTKAMTVTLAVPAGTLGAESAGGVTVAGTAGIRRFTGTLANLNSYFTASPGRVVYTPARNATATSPLTITIAETYGTQTFTSRAVSQLQITAVNDAPVVVAPDRFVVVEDTRTDLRWQLPAAGFSDVDSPSLTVTLSVPDGNLLAATAGGVAVSGTPTTRVLTGAPSALTAYFRTLGRITYLPALDNTIARTLTTTISDGTDTRVVNSTISITPVNDGPRLRESAVVAGFSTTAPLEITYETLRTATGATDVETANPTLVIQTVLSGTLERWSGTAWVRVPTAVGAPLAQRTLQPGQKLRWTSPAGFTGLQGAFRVTASDGVASSASACVVRILRL
jgi:hypothetical protein